MSHHPPTVRCQRSILGWDRRTRFILALAGSLLTIATRGTAQAPTPEPTGSIAIQVVLREPGGRTAVASDAAVWLVGAHRGRLARQSPEAARIAQRNKTFEPHVEIVPVGATVNFPNFDRVYHNVFSLSDVAPFDLGLYRNGASRAVTFRKPGVVRIYCNIHPHMAAFLVVVDGDYFAKTDVGGRARLEGVPVGTWTARLWHEKGGEVERTVAVTGGGEAPLRFELDGSRWRQLPHKNKYGKDYPPPDDDASRY